MTHECCNYCDCHCGCSSIGERLCDVLRHEEKYNHGWAGWSVDRNMNCNANNHQRYNVYIQTLNKKLIQKLEDCSGLKLAYVESHTMPNGEHDIHAIFDESWDI